MQQLPLTGQTDSRKLVEALYDFLAIVVRGWRLVAACVAMTMTGAVIYLGQGQAGLPGLWPASSSCSKADSRSTWRATGIITTSCSSPSTALQYSRKPHHDYPQPADCGACAGLDQFEGRFG